MNNKLSEFPLERAGLSDAPDNTVIVAWPGWNLTVGDVREAAASQGSATGIDLADLSTYDPDRDTPGMMEQRDTYKDGDYYKVEDVRAALARATPQHPAQTNELLQLLIESQDGIGGDWRARRDAAVEKAAATPQHSVTEQIGMGCDRCEGGYVYTANRELCTPCAACAIRKIRVDQRADAARDAARAQPLASTAATQPEQASIKTPYGYVVEQPDGHVTFFKEDPIGFRQKQWTDLRVVVHTLYSDSAALAIPASTAASEQQAGTDDLDMGGDLIEMTNHLSEWGAKMYRASNTYKTCERCGGFEAMVGMRHRLYRAQQTIRKLAALTHRATPEVGSPGRLLVAREGRMVLPDPPPSGICAIDYKWPRLKVQKHVREAQPDDTETDKGE